nr:RNA-directed DNA polymerase, eukaryota, reverse transcriptase zinc-binding domain protein [Tanacetum cinerariifolium]
QKYMLIAVYAPHDTKDIHMLWDYLQREIRKWKGEVVVMGDFNEDAWKEYPGKESNAIRYFIGDGDDEVIGKRVDIINKLHDIDNIQSMEMAQKTKIRWAGAMVDGTWIDNPKRVKREFFDHFNARFCQPGHKGATIQMEFPKKLLDEEIREIECDVTNDEIKRAVWDCGTDKAPGPDGFTFGFFGRFWNLIKCDVFDAVRSKQKQALIFKVDFEKAYASVRWDILDDVLRKFSPTEEFQFGKCLKQGDPLSLFLFILIMESLHLSFQCIVDVGTFYGIKIGGGLVNLSHIFYADDAVFIGQWCESNITTLVHVLECFHKAYGLRINMCKSKIMGIHVDGDMVKSVARKLGCLVLKNPFSYLGSIVGGSMSRKQSWSDIVERVKKRLSKWKMQTLSIRGRLTLVKLTVFNGHESNSKKATWVNWKKALLSKERGGLGVSSLYAMNSGLLFKWMWRFCTQGNTLWAIIIKAIHGVDGRIWVNSRVGITSCWMSITKETNMLSMKGIDLMQYMQIKVGNGESTAVWEDKWCEEGALKDMFPRVYALESCKHIMVATKFSQPTLSYSFRRHPRGGCKQDKFQKLEDLVRLVILTPIDNRWIWGLENTGEFSVASVQRLIDDKMLPSLECKTRWINYVPIKVNVHAWKVMTDSLPTRFNISRRAREVMKLIARWWNVPESDFDSYEEWLAWFANVRLPLKNKNMLEGVFYVLWWLLWWFRNKTIFEGKTPKKAMFFDDLKCKSFFWCRYRCNK